MPKKSRSEHTSLNIREKNQIVKILRKRIKTEVMSLRNNIDKAAQV